MGAASKGPGTSEASVRSRDCGGHRYEVRIVRTGPGLWQPSDWGQDYRSRQCGIGSVAVNAGAGVGVSLQYAIKIVGAVSMGSCMWEPLMQYQ